MKSETVISYLKELKSEYPINQEDPVFMQRANSRKRESIDFVINKVNESFDNWLELKGTCNEL